MITKLGMVIKEYSVRNKDDADIPVYSVTNNQGFCTGYFSKDVSSKDRTTYKIVPKGFFAYNPSRINVGSVDWQRNEEQVIVSPLYVVFEVKPEVDQQYLYHFLKSDITLTYIKVYATGSVRDNLKFSILSNFPINLPPIAKQREMAAALDRIEETIRLRRTELETLDELVKSRFIELFGDENAFALKAHNSVGDICDSRVGIVIQPTQYYIDNCATAVRAFRSLNIKPFCVNDADWVYFAKAVNDQLVRTQVHTNDVAVVRSGANLGDSCVIPTEYSGCNAIDILLLTCKKQILPIYLAAFINFPVGKKQIIDIQRGGAIKHLNLKQLMDARIYLPPMELQQQFATFVEQTDKSKLHGDLEVAA